MSGNSAGVDKSTGTAVILLMLVAAVAAGMPSLGTAAPGDPDTYAVAQGTRCTEVSTVAGGDAPVAEWYDYRNPYTDPPADTYSSYGTTEFQATHESHLLFYSGPDGVSLVLVHGRLGDEAGGSTLTMEFSGLPDGTWAVEDDDYPGRDDNWDTGGSTASIDWKWGDNRTDGGAYLGMEDLEGYVTITPGFNEDADAWGDWGYSGSDQYRMTAWQLYGPDGSAADLDMDRRAFVHVGGCTSEDPPEAALDAPETAATGEDVTLDASASTDGDGVAGYEWDFDGDGETDAVTQDPTVTHQFDSGGDQTVTVTAFDRDGNGDTASATVAVAVGLDASLSASPTTVAPNETVTFDASESTPAANITEYRWDFDGDGEIDETTAEPTTTHAYPETGEYDAAVTVVDDGNATDTAALTVTVAPDEPPTARLSAPTDATTGESVTFDASESTDDRGIAEFRWDFDGDGSVDETTLDPVVDHTYPDAGEYEVRLTVVDTAGQTANATATVTVSEPTEEPLEAALSASPTTTAPNETVTFDASESTPAANITEYRWDFDGDGEIDRTTAEPTTTHAFPETGEYDATVTVVASDGRTDAATTTVTVETVGTDAPPTAELDVPTEVAVGEELTLDASGSTDDGTIVEYRWSVDGDTGTDFVTSESTTTLSYDVPGEFGITVVVVDDAGQTDSANATVTVVAGGPTADLSVPDSATVNESVTLDASGSTPVERITEYRWDLDGDEEAEQVTTEPTLTHTFNETGEYRVAVTVVDDEGRTDTTAASLPVTERNEAPTASLSVPSRATPGESVTLDASGSTDDGGITEYRWDLDGDGEIDTTTAEPTLNATFEEPDTYTVSVTVVDDAGASATDSATLTVANESEPLDAAISVGTSEPTAGEAVSFDAGGSTPAAAIDAYRWSFGDSAAATGRQVTHTYTEPGSYQVTLTVEAADGRSATATTTVTVQADENDGGGPPDDGGGNDPPDDGGDDPPSGGGGPPGGGGGPPGGGGSDPPDPPDTPEPEPSISVSAVQPSNRTVIQGQRFSVAVTVTNNGTGTGSKEVEFEAEGQQVAARTLVVPPGENRSVTFTYRFTEPGTQEIELDHSWTENVTVVAAEPNLTVQRVSVSTDNVRPNQPVEVTATVANVGHAAGERDVQLRLFDEVVDVKHVRVPAGETRTVTFTRRIAAPGTYHPQVGTETATVHVAGDTSPTPTDTETTETGVPGFGLLVALAALVGAAAVLGRRTR